VAGRVQLLDDRGADEPGPAEHHHPHPARSLQAATVTGSLPAAGRRDDRPVAERAGVARHRRRVPLGTNGFRSGRLARIMTMTSR
jgi:hypothetical protein